MSFCKHRTTDKCKKDGKLCFFSENCFEPEELPKRTNADLIRAMTDEELARDRVIRIEDGCVFWEGDFNGYCLSKEEALKRELDWLSQPAEED